jgi:hypothetical protein
MSQAVLRRLLVSRKAMMRAARGNSSCSTDSIKMCCRGRYQTTAFELRTQQRAVNSSYSEPISLPTGLYLPRGIPTY